MSTKEKLIDRFKALPNDFTFDETVRLFASFGFIISYKGATSGSRVKFIKGKEGYMMHRPHPGSIMKRAEMRSILDYLTEKNLI